LSTFGLFTNPLRCPLRGMLGLVTCPPGREPCPGPRRLVQSPPSAHGLLGICSLDYEDFVPAGNVTKFAQEVNSFGKIDFCGKARSPPCGMVGLATCPPGSEPSPGARRLSQSRASARVPSRSPLSPCQTSASERRLLRIEPNMATMYLCLY